jgi:hypothetical protein
MDGFYKINPYPQGWVAPEGGHVTYSIYLYIHFLSNVHSGEACRVDPQTELTHAKVYNRELSCGAHAGEKVKESATETGIPLIERFVCGPSCKSRCEKRSKSPRDELVTQG